MDNPFIGLDAQTRELLNTLLEGLAKRSAVQLISLTEICATRRWKEESSAYPA